MSDTFPAWPRPTSIAAGVFGVLTVLSGGLALFGPQSARQAVGDAVPFVLAFNFLAGFAYLAGAAALWFHHPLARRLAWAIGLASLGVFAAVLIVMLNGTAFETRTVGAKILRSGFWLTLAVLLGRARHLG